MQPVALLVIAKQPLAGRVKTRLTPPLTPTQAASLAAAALADTLAAVSAARAARRVLVFAGDPAGWAQAGFEVVAQRGAGLDERLQAAFDDIDGPAVLIGMDTPQVSPALLERAIDDLSAPGVDGVLGAAPDGGYWLVGLRRPVADAFGGVPMSKLDTCARQRERFAALGLRVAEQPQLRDVDTIDDAREVARQAPRTRFAQRLAALA